MKNQKQPILEHYLKDRTPSESVKFMKEVLIRLIQRDAIQSVHEMDTDLLEEFDTLCRRLKDTLIVHKDQIPEAVFDGKQNNALELGHEVLLAELQARKSKKSLIMVEKTSGAAVKKEGKIAVSENDFSNLTLLANVASNLAKMEVPDIMRTEHIQNSENQRVKKAGLAPSVSAPCPSKKPRI